MSEQFIKSGDNLLLAGIVHDSITDGPGLRFVVFTQGCPHHCEGCHNPHTWGFSQGQQWSIEKLVAELDKNPLIQGVTLSGGEPFVQAKALAVFASCVKEKGLELAVYSGFLFEEIIKNSDMLALLKFCDILIDGKFDKNLKSLELNFKGSKNQRIIDVQKSLKENKAVLTGNSRWL